MHRTNHPLSLALWSIGLLVVGQAFLTAQPPTSAPREALSAARTNALIVPVNGTQRLQMSTKKRLVTVINQKETVARVQPVQGDPSSVIITGLEPGLTRITLTDENNVQESLDVIVQFDVEYLRTSLIRTVPTANIQVIPGANNTVVLTGTVGHAEDVDVVMKTATAVVGGLDKVVNALRVAGVMQVQLDVVIARVSRSDLRNMSFDFLNFGQRHVLGSTVGGGFVIPTAGISGTFPGGPVITNNSGSPNGVPANIFLAFFNPEQDFFGLLQALRDENLAKIKSQPSVVTQSGRPVSFLDGGEQAIPVPAGLGQIGVQFEEFGTRLNCLPLVLGNGKIQLEIEPEVSDLNAAFGTSINGTVVPGRTTQRAHATVTLESGQTIVLAGLIQHNTTGSTTKVPILGDLPFLGAAFSRKSFQDTESELIIMVTPHLVDAMACDQLPKTLPGEETRSPDDFELFLEGILEAPRGPRVVCPNHRYVPAFKNGPTAGLFPCAADGRCGGPGCGTPGATCSPGPNPGTLAPGSADGSLPKTGSGVPGTSLSVAGPTPDVTVSDTKPPTLPPVPGAGAGGQDK